MLAPSAVARHFVGAQSNEDLEEAAEAYGGALPPELTRLCALVFQPAADFKVGCAVYAVCWALCALLPGLRGSE